MAYTLPDWTNNPSTSSPLDADNLNLFNAAIDDLDTRVIGVLAVAGAAVGESLATAKGDLIVAGSLDVFATLSVDTDGKILTVDSTQTLGMAWADPAGVATLTAGDSSVTIDDTDPANPTIVVDQANLVIAESQVTSLTTDLAAKVPTTRQILAGTGLTGGGALSADRTLNVGYGTTSSTACVGNDSRLSNARTPTAHASTHATGGTDAVSPSSIGAATSARLITAGTGLTGGGDLTADRTLTVAYGTSGTTAAAGNDTRVVNAVQTTRLITAGTGLTGGGDLTADRTLTVAYGTSGTTAAAGNDTRVVNAVQTTRQVLAGTGLTGGGDLTADRTLTVAYGTSSTTATAGNDTRVVNAVQTTRQVLAGTGLTGGGDLTADRTLTVAYGTSSTTAAAGNDSRLSDSRAPTGTAGGVLNGTYPNPGLNLVTSTPYTHGTTTGTVTIDPTLGNNCNVGTLTGNVTITPSTTGALSGQMLMVVVDPGTSARTLTVTGPTMTTGLSSPFSLAASKIAFLGFRYNATLAAWVLLAYAASL